MATPEERAHLTSAFHGLGEDALEGTLPSCLLIWATLTRFYLYLALQADLSDIQFHADQAHIARQLAETSAARARHSYSPDRQASPFVRVGSQPVRFVSLRRRRGCHHRPGGLAVQPRSADRRRVYLPYRPTAVACRPPYFRWRPPQLLRLPCGSFCPRSCATRSRCLLNLCC